MIDSVPTVSILITRTGGIHEEREGGVCWGLNIQYSIFNIQYYSPELGESMKEEKEGFVGVSRLNVVQLHTIHSHIVMHTKVRIHLKK